MADELAYTEDRINYLKQAEIARMANMAKLGRLDSQKSLTNSED